MAYSGPVGGHRRGWMAVAAALMFGVFGGSAGVAVTDKVPVQSSVVAPAADPVLPVQNVTQKTAVPVRPSPIVVVTTHEVVRVVKVFVTVTPRPTRTVKRPDVLPSSVPTSQDASTDSTVPLPTAPAPTPTPTVSSVPTASTGPLSSASS